VVAVRPDLGSDEEISSREASSPHHQDTVGPLTAGLSTYRIPIRQERANERAQKRIASPLVDDEIGIPLQDMASEDGLVHVPLGKGKVAASGSKPKIPAPAFVSAVRTRSMRLATAELRLAEDAQVAAMQNTSGPPSSSLSSSRRTPTVPSKRMSPPLRPREDMSPPSQARRLHVNQSASIAKTVSLGGDTAGTVAAQSQDRRTPSRVLSSRPAPLSAAGHQKSPLMTPRFLAKHQKKLLSKPRTPTGSNEELLRFPEEPVSSPLMTPRQNLRRNSVGLAPSEHSHVLPGARPSATDALVLASPRILRPKQDPRSGYVRPANYQSGEPQILKFIRGVKLPVKTRRDIEDDRNRRGRRPNGANERSISVIKDEDCFILGLSATLAQGAHRTMGTTVVSLEGIHGLYPREDEVDIVGWRMVFCHGSLHFFVRVGPLEKELKIQALQYRAGMRQEALKNRTQKVRDMVNQTEAKFQTCPSTLLLQEKPTILFLRSTVFMHAVANGFSQGLFL